jgi:ATP-dependent DNA helicase RecG
MSNDISWILHKNEGQFFEMKSCFHRSNGTKKRRKPTEVAYDIAETISAMANADGGTLVLGIEDDGTPTGYDYPEDRLALLFNATRNLIRPPLNPRITQCKLDDVPVLLFEIDWSSDTHQLTDGRYLLRVGDKNIPFSARDIIAMKEGHKRRATEMSMVKDATLSDIDNNLITRFAQIIGTNETPEEILLRYRLAEHHHNGMRLTLAALLLFGIDPMRWHPRCGIDFVKYDGNERRHGEQLNIVKRERMDGSLISLIEKAYHFIPTQLRERQHLVDLFFEERLEYPTLAWQEAIVNAVAHRDYHYEGMSIEIWLFDERMEIRSPGELIEPVTIERLCRREHIHASRNPRIVRVLTDYGYMREQGEGIPRMFDVMEREGLYPPNFRMNAETIFSVSFSNTPIYSRDTLQWLSQFDLSRNQKRILAFAKEHNNQFTSRDYQKLIGIDLYNASKDIKDLIRRGIVRLPQSGGRLYEIAISSSDIIREKPATYLSIEALLFQKGFVKSIDIEGIMGVSRRQAIRIANSLVEQGWLISIGKGPQRQYHPITDEK